MQTVYRCMYSVNVPLAHGASSDLYLWAWRAWRAWLHLHHRPVTLVGSSFGAVVVVEALRHMRSRSHHEGIVENVYLFGAPVSGQASKWKEITPLIAGGYIELLFAVCVLSCV